MSNHEGMEAHYRSIIEQIGEDPEREGLLKTPERVSKAMKFLTHGYDINPDEIVKQAIFHLLDQIALDE